MQQHIDRRHDQRQPKAFALWLSPEGSHHRISAWMLDVSAGGASLLTAAEQAPPIGHRVGLLEMHTGDRMVREDGLPLPTSARVVRHDDAEGVTCRVAVRFEADEQVRTGARCGRMAAAAVPERDTVVRRSMAFTLCPGA